MKLSKLQHSVDVRGRLQQKLIKLFLHFRVLRVFVILERKKKYINCIEAKISVCVCWQGSDCNTCCKRARLVRRTQKWKVKLFKRRITTLRKFLLTFRVVFPSPFFFAIFFLFFLLLQTLGRLRGTSYLRGISRVSRRCSSWSALFSFFSIYRGKQSFVKIFKRTDYCKSFENS